MEKEIMKILDSISYGYLYNGIDITKDEKDDEFSKYYRLMSPKELMDKRVGVCWDQVELERYLFEKYKIPYETYFIFIDDGDFLPSHTFLIYEANNKFYWFEHAWFDYRGIYEYNSKEAMLVDIKNKFIASRKDEVKQIDKIYLYKYNKPNYGISCNEFYKYIETQELIEI